MYLQDIKTKKEYSFELKDRLIRDAENDGWKEIPAKADENEQIQTEDDESAVVKTLPGTLLSESYFLSVIG